MGTAFATGRGFSLLSCTGFDIVGGVLIDAVVIVASIETTVPYRQSYEEEL